MVLPSALYGTVGKRRGDACEFSAWLAVSIEWRKVRSNQLGAVSFRNGRNEQRVEMLHVSSFREGQHVRRSRLGVRAITHRRR
jgi:hypothetical protein